MTDAEFIKSEGYTLTGWQTIRGHWYAVAHSRYHRPCVVAPTKDDAIHQLAEIIRSEHAAA